MSDDDEIKDPQEALDEEEDEEDLLVDPIKLKKKGLHVEGEDELHDPDVPIDPLLEKDPLLPDDGSSEDEEEVELEDDAFKDPDQW